MITWIATIALAMTAGTAQKSSFGTPRSESVTQASNGGGNARGGLLVNPRNIATALAQVPGGVTLVLAEGDYGELVINKRSWARPITLDARKATMRLRILSSEGVRVIGGSYGNALGTGVDGYAILVRQSKKVSFENPYMYDSKRGLVFDRSSEMRVTGAMMTRLRIDGINIASSQKVVVTDSQCMGFITGDAHPDCIQMWSRPATGVTSDVTLLRNRSDGPNQGFAGFNHVRDGVDDGGFDRVVIKDNYVRGTYPQGVALADCRDCVVSDNTAVTMPTSKYRVSINVVRCTRCVISNNIQGARPSEL